MLRFGIDLGGTKIEGCVLDAEGVVRFRERIPTEAEGGAAHIVTRVAMLHARMRREFGNAPHALGIGTPGSLSPATGRLRNSNTVCLNGTPLHADLERALGHAVTIENDANCFALAEARLGAARGHRVVFGVILGTGCGGGVVIDGVVHRGRNALGGEWGHVPIDPAGPRCYCGRRGCIETFVSGSGVENRHAESTGERRTAQAVFAAAAAGDARAAATVDAFHVRFGQALATVVDILDPDVIVLGGGLSQIDSLYDRGPAAVRAHVFGDVFDTPIVRNALGDSAGVIGAALLGAARATGSPVPPTGPLDN